jgi:aromatic ring-cleaving dioxygenase
MINTYHAHVYFELEQLVLAERVRLAIANAIPEITYLGRLIPMLVGPHPKPMFEMHIPTLILDDATQKIELLREDLDVLIHPVHDNDFAAHTVDARWLGHALTLNIDIFNQLNKQ